MGFIDTNDKIVTLQVGEQRFTTTPGTLAESNFFFALLSGRWDNRLADGAYFIDADPKLFEHILRYLRRGILPIFYNSVGHDHTMYVALLEEAKYFQIPRLEKWLNDQSYLQLVKVRYSATTFYDIDAVANTVGSDVELMHYPTWNTQKVYLCPRRINSHRGDPTACGRACDRARGENYEKEYEVERVMTGIAVKKTIIFDQTLCLPATRPGELEEM
jgi:BTB/POZ domain-containing protein KCTD9